MPVPRKYWVPAHGENHLCAKLTVAKVLEIKVKRQSGVPQVRIAHEFGVSPSQVSRILNGKRWVRAFRENVCPT